MADTEEVRNPGTLMEGVTLRTLKTAKVSRRRNPLIADLLRRIQYIEAWGSGIPLILEKAPNVRFFQVAGIFITEFPRPSATEDTPEVIPEVTLEVTLEVARLLKVISGEQSRRELQDSLGLRDDDHMRTAYILPALANGWIERTLPDKPNSRLQKYRLPPKGHAALP